jgi:hypothetical protein
MKNIVKRVRIQQTLWFLLFESEAHFLCETCLEPDFSFLGKSVIQYYKLLSPTLLKAWSKNLDEVLKKGTIKVLSH